MYLAINIFFGHKGMTRSMENGKKHALPRSYGSNRADRDRSFVHCQWIYGEVSNREFCQNPAEQGRSWCRQRMAKVYVPAAQRRKDMKRLEKRLEMPKDER